MKTYRELNIIAQQSNPAMNRLNEKVNDEYKPLKFIEEIDKVLNKWSMKIYKYVIETDEYVPLRTDKNER